MKYLIAVDSSENSRYAFSQAKKRFFTQKDHVYILSVTESPTAYPFEDLLNFSSESYNEMNRKIEQMYAELLKKYGRKLTRASIPHTCLLARGTTKDVICRQAQDLCVDCVIMGRRGLGKLERTFMGSTSQYCVHNLNCSVLVIPYLQQEKTTMSTPDEIASKISTKEEEEVSGRMECFDPECKNEECLTHGSKFSKIGQYEREKWQIEREEEPKFTFHEEFKNEPLEERPVNPITSDMLVEQKTKLKHEEGTIDVVEESQQKEPIKEKTTKKKKKNKKNKNNKGNIGKSVGKWEDVSKDVSGKEAKDLPPPLPKEALPHDISAEPITGDLLEEQKKKLKHEEGTIDVIEEEGEGNVPQSESKLKGKEFKGKKESEGKWKGKDVSGTKEELKEEGGAGKLERLKEPVSKDVSSGASQGTSKKKNKKKNKNKGKSKEVSGKEAKDLPPPLPKESLPHDISAEPITGDLLEEQKKKLKHEEGTIDVIEEKKEEKLEKETVQQNVSSGKKNKRKKRRNNKNKGKAQQEISKDVSGKEAKDLPPPLPKESLPHYISSEPITGDLLGKQKKKLKHEEGTINVIEEEGEGNVPQSESKLKGKEFKGKKEEFKEEVKGKFSPKDSEGKWKGKDVSGTKEELKQEGGAGKFERIKEPVKEKKTTNLPSSSSPSTSRQEKECNDPLCSNPECEKHGLKSKEGEKKHPKWQGKVHEKKECNDPLCSNPNCVKHGNKSKEGEKNAPNVVGKSFAEIVSSAEEKGKESGQKSPQIIEKTEHKAAINIGEGKVEGKIGSKKDEEGKWKGSVEVGYKGKDEKGQEYQGKHLEASVQTK